MNGAGFVCFGSVMETLVEPAQCRSIRRMRRLDEENCDPCSVARSIGVFRGARLVFRNPIQSWHKDRNAQVIELVAKKYEYWPAPVHVEARSTVQLKITAVDHDHGFKIGAYPMALDPVVKVEVG